MEEWHPDASVLEAYAQGRLENQRMNAIEIHLRNCLACGRALDAVPDDRLSMLLRRRSDRTRKVRDGQALHHQETPTREMVR